VVQPCNLAPPLGGRQKKLYAGRRLFDWIYGLCFERGVVNLKGDREEGSPLILPSAFRVDVVQLLLERSRVKNKFELTMHVSKSKYNEVMDGDIERNQDDDELGTEKVKLLR